MKPEEGWIRAEEAGRILGLSLTQVHWLARRGRLERFPSQPKPGQRGYFREEQVRALAASSERLRRQERREQRKRQREGLLAVGMALEQEALVSCQEAATMLGVQAGTVRAMVRTGRLASLQEEPGRNGSRHWLLRRQVEWLRDHPARQKHRQAWERARPGVGELYVGEEPEEAWLTSKEVARWLGISEARVHHLRKSGRLGAYKRRRRGRRGPVWWHEKAAVGALLMEAQFQKKRSGWRQGEATKFEKALEWTMEINGWNRSEREVAYYVPETW